MVSGRQKVKDRKLIRAGWLIDGSGGDVFEDVLLEIKAGIIHDINPFRKDYLNQADVLDLSNSTILPGLVDSHVHLFMSGTDDRSVRDFQLVADYDDLKEVISRHTFQHLSQGVVAVRDGGDNGGHALRYKTENLKKSSFHLILKVAGKAWHRPGRYGKLIGRTPQPGESLAEAITGEKERGDHIKIVNSGVNSLSSFGRMTAPQFEPEELKSAVSAAGGRGLKVMVHANGELPVRIAIESGCHSIEHGFFMGKENLEKMAEKRVVWVPTVYTMKACAEHMKRQAGRIDPADVARRNLEHQLKQLSMAREFGVSVALGTDAGSLGVHHGAAVIEELKLFMEAGYSLSDAVRCATLNSAKLLGLKNYGTLEEKKSATFIAVKGGPSSLPASLKEIEALYIRGKVYED